MENNFPPNKEKHLRWKNAILNERKTEILPGSFIYYVTKKYVTNFDQALVFGDACQVNSKFLGENAEFKHIDNVDSSPLILDHYYDSNKMNPILSSFENFQIQENTYDLIYGKSITFIEKDKLPEFLREISAGLKQDGVFSAVWHLPKNTVMSESNWGKTHLREINKRDRVEFNIRKRT